MFFKNNQNLLIGAGAALIAWLILYYVFVDPNWVAAAKSTDEAATNRAAWVNAAKNDKDAKIAEKHANGYMPRVDAKKRIDKNSAEVEVKQLELHGIEFGNRETLKPFSVLAAGKGGDPQNLLAEKIKQAVLRANAQFKVPLSAEKIQPDSDQPVSVNLLRMALLDRFLTACKDAGIEQIVQVKYPKPETIKPPVIGKDEDDEAAAKKNSRFAGEKDKDAEAGPEVEKLIQFPMRALVRAPEKNAGQLLYELEKPTTKATPDDHRGYFCVRGFHIAAKDPELGLVELSVGISGLIRESEVNALGISIKTNQNGFNAGDKGPDPF